MSPVQVPKSCLVHVKGGVLYVRPRKARNLVKKSFFKGGWLHSTATVHVSMAGHEKKSAQVDGSNPTFSDVIEFILGLTQPKLFVQFPGFLWALTLPRCRSLCCQCTQIVRSAIEQRPCAMHSLWWS